jgi:hypothetical protein
MMPTTLGKVSCAVMFLYRWVDALRSNTSTENQTQAFRHVFTSPSSVDKEVKATRSGNAMLHGMTRVTPASLAYIATQV